MIKNILVLCIFAAYCEIAYLYFANERKVKTKMLVIIPVRGKLESRKHFEKRCMSLVRNGVISMASAQRALMEDIMAEVPEQKTVPPMPKVEKPKENCAEYRCKADSVKEFESVVDLLIEVARLEKELADARKTADNYMDAYIILQNCTSCNDCAVVRYCKYAPKFGDPVRYNCPHHIDVI